MTRTEDDLRTLFADEASDVCGSAEILSRLAANRAPRRRRWVPALVASAAVVVVAGIVVALTGGGPSQQPTPPISTGWHTVSYPSWHMTLQAPPDWRSYQYPVESSFSTLVGYLSTATLHDPCVRTPTSISCGQPIGRLAANDVLVAWWLAPGPTPRPISGLGGERTVLGGRAAVVGVTAADDACAQIGGHTSISAAIGRTRDPHRAIEYQMQACLGPDASRSDVLTMLHTVEFAAHQASATVKGRLLAVGGPPGPARPEPGTVTLRSAGGEITVLVGTSGHYSAEVPPGRYEIEGHSPNYGGGKYLCQATGRVRAAVGESTTANVYCQEK